MSKQKLYVGPWLEKDTPWDTYSPKKWGRIKLGENTAYVVKYCPGNLFRKYEVAISYQFYEPIRFLTLRGAKDHIDRALTVLAHTDVIFLSKEQFDKLQILL